MSVRLIHWATWRIVAGFLLSTFVSLSAYAYDLSRATELALHVQTRKLTLVMAGNEHDTRLNTIDLIIREPLAEDFDGAVLFGHTNTTQSTNPILAGQDTLGGYLGLDLRYQLIRTPSYALQLRGAYFYTETEASREDQDLKWRWHQLEVALNQAFYISKSLTINLGASSLVIEGREEAVGPVNQNLNFEAKDSTFGKIGLQFNLERSGQVALELQAGAIQGGQVAFSRAF